MELSRDYIKEPLKQGELPVKEDLIQLRKEKTITELSKYFGKGKSTVGRWLKKYGIYEENTSRVPETKEYISIIDVSRLSRDFTKEPWKRTHAGTKEDISYLYTELNLSAKDIANYLGLSLGGVQGIVKRYKLKKSREQHYKNIQEANLKKYGREYAIASKDVKDKIKNTMLSKYGVTSSLSLKVTHEKAQTTMNERYGAEHALQVPKLLEKSKKTCLDKYGVECSLQAESVKEKARQTNLRKYGVPNGGGSKEAINKAKETLKDKYGEHVNNVMDVNPIKEQIQDTCVDRYGSISPLGNSDVREKAISTLKKHYNVDHPWKIPEVRKKINDYNKYLLNTNIVAHPAYKHVLHKEHFNRDYWLKNFIDIRSGAFCTSDCARYHGVENTTIVKCLDRFGITLRHKHMSINEVDILEYLDTLGIKAKQSDRSVLKPKELDIYAEDIKIAIEYDGLMYHSIGDNQLYNKTDRYYHLRKTEACEDKGIQLFHIFDNEWLTPYKKDIWKSMISAKTGNNIRIYARKTTCREITHEEAYSFCEENHMQGGCASSVHLGLFFEDSLVAVMTFSKPRFSKKADWELIRYCSKIMITVVGGASKLLKTFRSKHNGSIISYANRRWSSGELYEKLGFRQIDKSMPNYFYFKTLDGIKPSGLELYSRVKFQKHKLESLHNKRVLTFYDKSLTEKEIMFKNNYRLIYDCGNLVYLLD